MLEAPFYHSHKWVLALSDISNQVFSLYPYAKSLQTSFKTGQTPKSRRVCQAESVRQFFPRRRSVDQLPTADSASKYLLSDPSSLLLQQSNLASEHCGGVGACLDCLQLCCSVAGQEVGRGCCCKHHRRWRRLQSVRGFPWLPFCSRSGGRQEARHSRSKLLLGVAAGRPVLPPRSKSAAHQLPASLLLQANEKK